MGRFLLVWGVCALWHLALYYSSQYLEGEPCVVGWAVDQRIPLVPGFIYIYCSWFFLLFLVPFALWQAEGAVCVRYLAAYALDALLSFAVYLWRPTTFTRPAPAGRGLTNFFFRTVYGANHRFLNCIPSLHCSVSLLFLLAALGCPGLPVWTAAAVSLLAVLICVSTVLVKQHMLVDVLTAIPMAALCWLAAGLLDTQTLAAALGL